MTMTPEDTARAEVIYQHIRGYLQRAGWFHAENGYWSRPGSGYLDMLSAYGMAVKDAGEEAVRRLEAKM